MTFPLATLTTDKDRLKSYAKKLLEIANRGDDEEIARRHLEFVQILKLAHSEFLPNQKWLEVSGDYDRLGLAGFDGVEFYGIGPPRAMRGALVQKAMNPDHFEKVDSNEVSVVIQIRYAGRSVVLGGDAIDANWIAHRKFRSKVNKFITSDVVKLPHHGSRNDNSIDTLNDFFLGKSRPIAIISAGGRSHPDLETMETLEELSCARLCTNLFNPNEKSLKRIYNNSVLESRLRHYLNVYATPIEATRQVCKGDICVSIHPDGAIMTSAEFNSLCACTPSISSTGAPELPSQPPMARV